MPERSPAPTVIRPRWWPLLLEIVLLSALTLALIPVLGPWWSEIR